MIVFSNPRIRFFLGLPTVRVYADLTLALCDKCIPQKPWLPTNVDIMREAIVPARLAYVLAVRQGANSRTIGVLLRQYLTVCLRAHRPELVSLSAIPLMHRVQVQGFDLNERREISTLLNEGTEWYHRGIRPNWLGKPACTR